MSRRKFKYLLIILGISFFTLNCQAKKMPWYIITSDADTLYGQVKLYKYNVNSGSFIVNGIDLEWYHLEVRFRSDGQWKFQNFTPEMINGFGFFDNSIEYIFKSFPLKYKSIIPNERLQQRFLNLTYKGEVSLYKNIVRRNNAYSNSTLPDNSVSIQLQVYYEYYLFDTTVGLTKVEETRKAKTVAELLLKYNLDQDFIRQLPLNTKFKDINRILYQYDLWLVKEEANLINI